MNARKPPKISRHPGFPRFSPDYNQSCPLTPALPASDFRSKSNGNVPFAGESRHLHYRSRFGDAQILSWLPSSTTRFAGRR